MIQNLENEIWKDIDGYEGLYKVSNMGRICSHEKSWYCGSNTIRRKEEVIITTYINKFGYWQVSLCKNGIKKSTVVHRIIAKAFIYNADNKPYVNHINGIKSDNRIENLEWCTAKENVRHAYKYGLKLIHAGDDASTKKLNSIKVREILNKLKNGEKVNGLSKSYGVSVQNIYSIKKGRTWKQLFLTVAES